ncbi:hypothetical protein PIB30_092531 [Stylosanthes scabra]|uniref:Zinc finger GRF-type domain-containing protein n=1 Tax=Stylosanthes scabra TaxID=79078 RepID=A0ABU6WT82_9FABA|nr:hypothetical protein [Stylosanthes scabra]
MKSEGGLSASMRSAGGGRGDRSSAETQGFFAAKVGHERDRAAPKCHCGVYAVLYLSKTSTNPNRLFFGCPFFKEEEDDMDEHFWRLDIEKRVSDLEDKIALIERKGSCRAMVVCVFALSLVIAVYFGNRK